MVGIDTHTVQFPSQIIKYLKRPLGLDPAFHFDQPAVCAGHVADTVALGEGAQSRVPTSYEPIHHNSDTDAEWIMDVMKTIGSEAREEQVAVHNYNNAATNYWNVVFASEAQLVPAMAAHAPSKIDAHLKPTRKLLRSHWQWREMEEGTPSV